MRGNIISVKQVIKDAKGAEQFMPSDIAFDELERLATLGCHFERIEQLPPGASLHHAQDGRWYISFTNVHTNLCKSIDKALSKAAL